MRTLVLFLSITGCLSMTCHQIRTVYNDHSCCRDSPTDTCLRTMPVCNETSNTSICTEAGIPTIKVDNTTIFLNENGTLYTTGSGGGSSTNIAVDNTTIKQYANGTIYAVGGVGGGSSTVVEHGQVLEELSGICDGRSIQVNSGTYTLGNVSSVYEAPNAQWSTITGSEISYKPPLNTKQVIYIFNVKVKQVDTDSLFTARFVIDNQPVTLLRPDLGISAGFLFGYYLQFRMIIDIGTDDIEDGKIAQWNTLKTMKLEVWPYKDSNPTEYKVEFHASRWIENSDAQDTAAELHRPSITIRAIGTETVVSGGGGVTSYNDLTDKPDPYTLPSDLTTFDASLQVAGSKFGLGTSPEASFHIGLSENVDVNISRFECDGSGAIIEQTSGKVQNIMTRDDCSKLSNFESGVVLPATTAAKHADSLCKTGESYQTYAFHYIHVTSGSSSINKLTIEECREFARKNGYSFATGNWNSDPNGCYYHNTNNNIAYYNGATTSNNCGASNYNCVRKLNVKLVSSGTNTGSEALSEAECMAWGATTGRWNRHLGISSLPPGCMQNGPGLGGAYDHSTASIYWNSGSGSCSDSRYCVMRDTSLDNPGTPNDQHRVNACRDRCSDPTSKIWTGLTYGVLAYHTTPPFTPASFSVEPTGGECTCHEAPAATCQLESNNQVDFYALNWRPKGCFKDTSTNTHYHTDVDGGVCSEYFPCLRNDEGCLVQDQTNETKSISLISEQSAWFKNEIIVSSDQRIKTNITHVDNALSILRDIPTRYYDYVDHRRGSTTIGFLAQEVAQVLPSAVKKQNGYIPSHMKRITCVFNYTDALRIHCPELDDDKKYKLYVSNPDEGEKSLEIRNHGVIDKVYTSIYCFGEEVEDFHVLEKSKLFAIAFSATQELDKLVSTLRQEVDELKAKVYN